MGWLSVAILSAGIQGIVNIIDSHLLSRRMPSLAALLFPVAIIHIIYGLVVFAIFPFPEDLSVEQLGIAVGSGILRGGAVTVMLYTMTREEVSQVIPVVYTYPIFVGIMAVIILGEQLLWLHWLAIVIMVAGAILVSLKRTQTGTGLRLGKSFYLLLVSSLLMAGADVASKYALSYISFWNMFSLSAFCMSSLFLLVSLPANVFKELKGMERPGSAMALLALNEALAPIGILLAFRAIQEGPVSLVSTIIGSRPIFVFIYALALTRIRPDFLEWYPTRATLVLRLTGTVMIVGGIAIIQQLAI